MSSSNLIFLVVDDAAFIRDLIKKTLRSYFPGCTLLDASGAQKAQTLMRTNAVDLILSDWEMPEMSGEEFLRWVREQEKYQSTPFIMVSSRGERDYVIKAVQAGVSDYIGKPFTSEDLIRKVSKALQRVGKLEKAQATPRARGVAEDSIAALGAKSVDEAAHADSSERGEAPPPANNSASVLMGGAATGAEPAPAKPQPKKAQAKGQAQLNFATGQQLQCVVREISLQAMQGIFKRTEPMPSVFDQVVISLIENGGEDVARLNGYVHSLQAVEQRIDGELVKAVIRFVDEDPQKLEQLSHYIANL